MVIWNWEAHWQRRWVEKHNKYDDDADEDAANQLAAALTVEANSADVSQQLLAIDVGHARAQAGVSGTELAVHVVQSVGHGVHGVHHKLNLSLLLVGGVTTDFLQSWNRNNEVSGDQSHKNTLWINIESSSNRQTPS